jgi:hypothetical protein
MRVKFIYFEFFKQKAASLSPIFEIEFVNLFILVF